MPAQSKQQQKLFGLALSVKRGDTPRSEVSDDVLGIVDKMSEKEIEDFASTDHKGLPTKKEEIEEILRDRIREMLNPIIKEGRAFIQAAKKAQQEGKTEFEFNGKTYPITLKEEVITEISDKEFVGDQLIAAGEGSLSRNEFIKIVSKKTKLDKNMIGKVHDIYLKLDGRQRVKLDTPRNMDRFLDKLGITESIKENGDTMEKEIVNEEMVKIEVDMYKQYNQRKPDRTMPMKIDSKTPLSKLLNHTTFKAMKQKYDYIELHYGDKFLGSAMAGRDNWQFKKGRGLQDTSFRESVNEANGEFVTFIEKDNGRKKLLRTSKSQRAANMFMRKHMDSILNKSGIRSIGTMSKDQWEKKEAMYAENTKKKALKTVTRKKWNKTHRDFKTIIDGQPYMTWYDEKTHATVLGPVHIKEVRQLKDPKKEMMVAKKGKVKVIDKKDWNKYKGKGYVVAENKQAEELWSQTIDMLDKNLSKGYDPSKIRNVNLIAGTLQKLFKGLPQRNAMDMATTYNDYRAGQKDKKQTVKNWVRILKKHQIKEASLSVDKKDWNKYKGNGYVVAENKQAEKLHLQSIGHTIDMMDKLIKKGYDPNKYRHGIVIAASLQKLFNLSNRAASDMAEIYHDYKIGQKDKKQTVKNWVRILKKHQIKEASLSVIHKAAKKGSYPVTVMAIDTKKRKVVKQELVKTPMAVPAAFMMMQGGYPEASIAVEDAKGQIIFKEKPLK